MSDSTPRWDLANAGAVPGTGKKTWGHMFRYPRNVGAKRALEAFFGTLRGLSSSIPPDDYDDLSISTRYIKNWKRHRRTRWKENGG